MLRRRVVSSMAYCIESVIMSAYKMTLPSLLRAARPIVWISEVSERKNPALSASSIPIKATSGKSSPSRSKFTPTKISKSPLRNWVKIFILSMVLISLCKYSALIFLSFKYTDKSSAIFFVSVVAKTRKPFLMVFSVSSIKSEIWPL